MSALRALTTRRAADAASVTTRTIRRWVDERRLPASYTATGRIRIDEADLRKFVSAGQRRPPARR